MKKEDKRSAVEKQNMPYLAKPVISREGKIARLNITEETEEKNKALPQKKNGKSAKKVEKHTEKKRKTQQIGLHESVTISDGEFVTDNIRKLKKSRGVHTVKSKAKNPFPLVTLIASVVCTMLFMSLVFNLVRINEYTKDVSDMRAEVDELSRQKNELNAALSEKNNVEELKKYLSEHAQTMGMVEEGKMNPPVAVTPPRSEAIEDFEAEEESEAIITTILDALSKSFADAWGLFTGK